MRQCIAIEPVRFSGLVVIPRKVSLADLDHVILMIEHAEGYCQVAGGPPLLGPVLRNHVIPVENGSTISSH